MLEFQLCLIYNKDEVNDNAEYAVLTARRLKVFLVNVWRKKQKLETAWPNQVDNIRSSSSNSGAH